MALPLGSTSKGGIVRLKYFHPTKMVGRWNISRRMVLNPILISRKISELLFNVFRQSFLGFVISFLRSSPWPKPKGDHPQIWGFFRIFRIDQLLFCKFCAKCSLTKSTWNNYDRLHRDIQVMSFWRAGRRRYGKIPIISVINWNHGVIPWKESFHHYCIDNWHIYIYIVYIIIYICHIYIYWHDISSSSYLHKKLGLSPAIDPHQFRDPVLNRGMESSPNVQTNPTVS